MNEKKKKKKKAKVLQCNLRVWIEDVKNLAVFGKIETKPRIHDTVCNLSPEAVGSVIM